MVDHKLDLDGAGTNNGFGLGSARVVGFGQWEVACLQKPPGVLQLYSRTVLVEASLMASWILRRSYNNEHGHVF